MKRFVCRYRIGNQEQEVEVQANSLPEAIIKGVNNLSFPKDRKRFTIQPLGCEELE